MLTHFDVTDLLIGMAILPVLLAILWRRKKSGAYLLFFSVFWIYFLNVVQVVIFPIYVNVGDPFFGPSINLIPFYFGACEMPDLCVRGVINNIILTIPFGFGINFLARVKTRNSFWLSLVVGFGFELLQLVISLVFRSGFRAVDINDAILNAVGVLLGYALFRAFAWAYVQIAEYLRIENKRLFMDIYSVALQGQAGGRLEND
jgi:glycopeptide antibiotics resistance protein